MEVGDEPTDEIILVVKRNKVAIMSLSVVK
jgi:hypothetical protein